MRDLRARVVELSGVEKFTHFRKFWDSTGHCDRALLIDEFLISTPRPLGLVLSDRLCVNSFVLALAGDFIVHGGLCRDMFLELGQ